MPTDYNQIAEVYQETKRNPLRKYVDEFTFLTILGDVKQKSVLDLACGYGHYSRLIKQQGAAQVIGVDISEALIAQARQIERNAPLGIEYRRHDVAALGKIGNFDVVTAIYLFPYASTQQTLFEMCQAIYKNLKPGGRLVVATLNPLVTEADLPLYQKYGVNLHVENGLRDGTQVVAKLDIPDGVVELVAHYWSAESYETALQQPGFRDITWHPMQVSDEGIQTYGAEYWQPYLAKPVDVMLECYR